MTVEEIKAEMAKLPVTDRLRLSDWIGEDRELHAAKVFRLRADIQIGLDQIKRGEFTECSTPEELDAFFEDIKATGRTKLETQRGEPVA